MDPAAAQTQAVHDTEDWLHFDPRSGRSRGAAAAKSKASYSDAIVFVVGGGGYVEYSDLIDFAARSSSAATAETGYAAGPGKKRITYGSTEIFSASQFLKTLGNLAAPKS